MPLIPPLILYIAWCAAMSLMALAYGGFVGARQAAGRPVVGLEWVRNLLILFAVAVNVSALFLMIWTSLPLQYLVDQLKPVAAVSLAPLFLWYAFVVPIRLLRYLTRRRAAPADAPHPLDGTWPAAASFLDQINAHRGHLPVGPGGGAPAAHPSSPALDRVARLQPVAPPPADRPR